MINALLKAKHWQLFLIMFALPLMAYFVFFGSFFTSIMSFSIQMEHQNEPDPEMIFAILDKMKWMYILAIIPVLLHALWQWSISVGLYNRLPQNHGMNLNLFRWFMIISVLMAFISLYIVADFMGSFSELTQHMDGGVIINEENFEQEILSRMGMFFMIIPLSLISAVLMFYCHYHTGKTLKLIEHGDKPGKVESIGEFFLIWFYYIGVWFIQPRVNRVVADEIRPEDSFITDRES